MRAHETRTIDDQEWTVVQFGATKGLKIATRLMKVLSGPLGKAVSGFEGNLLDAKINVNAAALGEAISNMGATLDPEEIVELTHLLLVDNVRCDGEELNQRSFDKVFRGRYGTLLKVVAFVVEVNFQVPLTGWLASLGDRGTEGEPQSIREAS